tara:strand:+ start:9665 stop:11401 length:1737 start_codon:yes stop_codon:yes gene_type:complete
MKIPIVVIHEGNQPYVFKCLKETLRHNPLNDLILLGDDTNSSMSKEIGVKHIHINSLPVSGERTLFLKHFVNYSSNSHLFEMRCFFRYFRLFEFMKTYNVEKLVHLDSDVALLCDSSVWQNVENGFSIPKERIENPLRMANSNHTAVKTFEYIRKFIDLCNDIYVTKKKFHLIEEKVNYHKNVSGGICDMTICYLLNLTEKNVTNLCDPSASISGGVIMNNITSSEGDLGINQYEMKNGLLSLYVENDKYYLYDTIRKKKQLLLNIHFQGTSKKLLGEDYNSVAYEISSLPNIIHIDNSLKTVEETIKQPKTLVVLHGNSRGSEVAWQSLYNRVLKPLNADLALVLPKGEEKNSLYERAKYIKLIDEYDDWGDCIDEILQEENMEPNIILNWRNILLKNEYTGLWGCVKKDNKKLTGSGAIGFCHRYYMRKLIIDNQLDKKYDRFIIGRTDTYYAADHPDLDNDFTWIPEGEDYGGICDRHLVVNKKDVLKCLDVLLWVIKQRCTFLGNPEHVEQLFWKSLNLNIKRFKRTLFLVKSKTDKTRWGLGQTYIKNLDVVVKYDSELNMTLSNLHELKPTE